MLNGQKIHLLEFRNKSKKEMRLIPLDILIIKAKGNFITTPFL